MKKRLGAVIITMCCLTSCVSLQNVSFDELKPATITFSENVKTVAVVNNMPSTPEAYSNLLTLGYLEGDGKISAEALATALADANYFNQVIICDSALQEGNESHILTSGEIQDLADILGADLIFSLERIAIHTEKRDLYVQGSYEKWPVVYAKITPVLNVYSPLYSKPMHVLTVTDSLMWDMKAVILSDKELMEETARFVAYKLMPRLVPYWNTANRMYYSGVYTQLRNAGVAVEEHNWKEAAELWESFYRKTKSKKMKYKMAFNLALASEMAGNLEKAQQWLDKAKTYIDLDEEEGMIWEQYKNQLNEKEEDYRLLNKQMLRFKNSL